MMSTHPLDHPAWSALAGRQASFSISHGGARRYDPSYGVFAGVEDWSDSNIAALGALVAEHGDVAIIEAEAPRETRHLKLVSRDLGVQMVAERLERSKALACDMVALGANDAQEMLGLAAVTKPGPFFAKTHQLGAFFGVRHEGHLVAMAGERMKPDGYTEVSGVCTHPAYRGRGYAAALMHLVATRILDRGETPFLHAYASNVSAIALYSSIGFVLRREVRMTRLGSAASARASGPTGPS